VCTCLLFYALAQIVDGKKADEFGQLRTGGRRDIATGDVDGSNL
jgi:hypothetical protein